jgi:hypothetical protein
MELLMKAIRLTTLAMLTIAIFAAQSFAMESPRTLLRDKMGVSTLTANSVANF